MGHFSVAINRFEVLHYPFWLKGASHEVCPFRPSQVEITDKTDVTTTAVRRIQEEEKRAREKKTAKLREAREASKKPAG